MTTIIEVIDNTIVATGDVEVRHKLTTGRDGSTGNITASDGTILEFLMLSDNTYKFFIIYKGDKFDYIKRSIDYYNDSLQYSDCVYFKDGLISLCVVQNNKCVQY